VLEKTKLLGKFLRSELGRGRGRVRVGAGALSPKRTALLKSTLVGKAPSLDCRKKNWE